MSGDLTGTVWVDGQEITLSAEQVRAALSQEYRVGRSGGKQTPGKGRGTPVQPGKPKTSPARERLMAELGRRGFVPELRFKGTNGKRQFKFDAALISLLIGVDFHGFGSAGAHAYRTKQAGDQDKLNEAQLCGWLYLICNAISVKNGRCLEHVDAAIAKRYAKIKRGAQ